ncbi:ABC transporter permease [Aquitalea aquatilis]|uniref:ABC transporter permease n=1 Tax=Aquitalea aquatilis TaxID=1537400 RepID=UPI0010BCF58C|nr:ABC transporter permease [Aquitalea aquatilis]
MINELMHSFKNRDFWLFLGWNDIRQRYRRTAIGPLWLTLSTGFTVLVLGLLWSTIFKLNTAEYLPFFSIAHVFWIFISSQISEACTAFSQFEYIIKQIKLPFTVYILRVLFRNFIVLLHNIIIVFIVLVVFDRWSGVLFFRTLLGLVILLVGLFSLSLLLAIVCARFRDVTMLVQNFLFAAFYVTPIMWKPNMLGSNHQWVSDFNPLAAYISIIRDPILGSVPPLYTYIFASAFTIVLFLVSSVVLRKNANSIAYWM